MNKPSKFDWSTLNISTPERLYEFAVWLEEGGQEAVAAAIADHKAAGNPVYFRPAATPEILVKELPDGRRFHVTFGEDGAEQVGAQVA